MSNFIETFKAGKRGENMGLSTGLPALDRATNGIHRFTSIGVAAAPKVGKTVFVDYCYVLAPYMEMKAKGELDNIEWIYYSYEIDRVNKEFRYAAFFMAHQYGVYSYNYKGEEYGMDQDYLMGRKLHKLKNGDSERIPTSEEHEKMLQEIYVEWIVPMFGEFDDKGRQIAPGKIKFFSERENPTGINKYLRRHAEAHGEYIKEKFQTVDEKGNLVTREKDIAYVPNNPLKYTLVLMDHVRKLRRERGFVMKENIDKWLEYTTDHRNLTGYTFINVCHSNRGVSNVDRLRLAGEFIFPTSDDVKDTGNLAEESTMMLTLFNPHDEKYNLKTHFGLSLDAVPHYRSIHLTESRYTSSPQHVQVNMFHGINMLSPINY